ncbi:MAG TPA: tyrosine--tRNA ligase [Candidatus Mcinerneyibacteriales bacterium]|nr:tyrosine--tRNA ligase [Candidatus Mcinerneyibacteriales bacterium]
MQNVYDTLKARGFIENVTDEEAVKALLNEPRVCYTGFDPTGDSLHVGHLLPIMALMHMERAGHKPIALLGGGTAMIGDPSGKTEMRQMITAGTIEANKEAMKKQIGHYLDVEGGKSLVLDNARWLLPLNYIEFLREIGRHFSVNRMLAAEAYKQRLERGLSFIEFNYQILQAFDFLTLYRSHGCLLQMGGNDQWGNILAGEDLVRRLEGKEVHAFTYPLLTTADGKKMGKTEKGAVWLSSEKLSPYEYFQFWRNVEDSQVIKLLKLFTFLPLEEISEMEEWTDSRINDAKERLAYEATVITHGEEEARKALEATKAVFAGAGASNEALPGTEIKEEDLKVRNWDAASFLAELGFSLSKSEAKRLIKQGGVSFNGEKVSDFAMAVTESCFDENKECLIKMGKKTFFKVVLK